MHRDGVGNFQLVEVLRRVNEAAVVHPHHHGAVAGVDGLHNADVAVVRAHALFPADALPGNFVVVAHLHHFVAHPEHPGRALDLRLALLGRVEQVLQLHIERLRACGAELCRAEHLNVPDGVEVVAAGQAGGNEVAHQLLRHVAVGFEEEEIVCFAAFFQRLAGNDVVGVLHDEALCRLPEDLVEADGGHKAGADHFAQNVAGPHAGQLVGVAHHDDAAAVPQRRDEGLKQLHVHHTHLVEDDHVALEQVFVVVDEADHAARVVHFQQAVDGGGLAARQLAQTLGRAARGGAEGHPLGLIFQQLQNGVDGGGLARAGAARQHEAIFGHGLADGFLLQGRIGKPLRQFQHLNVFLQIAGGVFPPPRQHGKAVGDVLFRRQQIGQINVRHAVKELHPQLFRLQAAVQRRRQLFGRLMDEVGGRVQQLRPRQAGMAVARVVAQGAQQSRFQPLGAVPRHVVILGDAVGVAEIQLQRLAAQQIRILGDGVHGPGAEGAEDLHGLAGANLELGEVGDELPHPEHPLELLLDAVGLVRRDAGDGGELGRIVGDDLQRLRAEFVNDLIRRAGPDVGQRAAGEESIDGFQVFGHIRLALLCVELAAVGRVVLVLAPADDRLARVQLAHHAADHRHHAAARHLKNGVAIIRVFVDDVLYCAFQLFQLLLHVPSPPFGT